MLGSSQKLKVTGSASTRGSLPLGTSLNSCTSLDSLQLSDSSPVHNLVQNIFCRFQTLIRADVCIRGESQRGKAGRKLKQIKKWGCDLYKGNIYNLSKYTDFQTEEPAQGNRNGTHVPRRYISYLSWFLQYVYFHF